MIGSNKTGIFLREHAKKGRCIVELFKASHQWASRPADERFGSVEELHQVCTSYRGQARSSDTKYGQLRAVAVDGDVKLEGSTGAQCALTHWAFGQAAGRANAPAGYLRELPPQLAAQCLQHGFNERAGEPVNLMFHSSNGDGLVLRSLTSERYDRIWNCDITVRLLNLLDQGWRVPPARPAHGNQPGVRVATEDDCLGDESFSLSVKPGDLIAPAGLYASDHDLFVFLVNPARRLKDGSEGGLSRGFFAWNSEVGAASFGISYFLYRHVCGNHIVWDASDVKTVRIRHIGKAGSVNERAFRELSAQLVEYDNSSASDMETKIQRARTLKLGDDKDKVLDRLLGMRLPVSQSTIKAAIETAETLAHENDPRSVYGITNALTLNSQKTAYADERVSVDRAAAKVMQVAF